MKKLLNIKSENSFLKSNIKIIDLINYAIKNEIKVLGLVDIETTRGLYTFYLLCKKNNIKPLLGMELNFQNHNYLIYAKNSNGYYDLLKISSDFANNKLNNNFLENSNLLILQKNYDQYIRIHQKTSKFKIQTINCLSEDDSNVINTLKAIEQNQNYQNHFVNNYPQGFDENCDFTDEINIDLPKKVDEINYPYIPSKFKNEHEFLTYITHHNLKKIFPDGAPQKYIKRLNEELAVIIGKNFTNYFLIVADIVGFAKKNNIFIGPGRGSSGGSLIAYILSITTIDPIKYNLYFERFLNPQRNSMPDIDLDFDSEKRSVIINYIFERFGKDYAAQIGTLQTFGSKSAIRDVLRVHEINLKIINKISQTIITDQNLKIQYATNLDFKVLIDEHHLLKFLQIAQKIEGIARHSSIHAAGVIIAPKPLNYFTSIDEQNTTLYNAQELETMGLLKIDILGLSNLSYLRKITKEIQKSNPDFTASKIPLNDAKTFQVISQGDVLGIFQLESRGMMQTLKKIKPQNIDELALAISLYRPGPQENIDQIAAIKAKEATRKKINYLYDQIVDDTYGYIVYQEQVMKIFQVLANYSLAEADLLRRAIGKKDQKLMAEQKRKFIEESKKQIDEKTSLSIWSIIEQFANYGFNKAHAVAYAILAYQLTYLKTNYKIEYYTIMLNSNLKGLERNKYLKEFLQNEQKILLPAIHKADLYLSRDGNDVRLGLCQIDGIAEITALKIIENRAQEKQLIPFINETFKDEKLSVKVIKSLIAAGSFDELTYENRFLNRHELEIHVPILIKIAPNIGDFAYQIPPLVEYSFQDNAQKEFTALGFNLKYDEIKYLTHTIESNKNFLINQKAQNIKNFLKNNLNNANIIGKVTSIFETRTKNNDLMAFIKITDNIFDLEIIAFPRNYFTIKKNIHENKVYLFKVKKQKDSFIVESIIQELTEG